MLLISGNPVQETAMSDETDNGGTAADRAAPALDFPVVGIGASAGGIAALRTFFAAAPEKPGMAFIVVLHLHPEHESHLADLLRKVVKLPCMRSTATRRSSATTSTSSRRSMR